MFLSHLNLQQRVRSTHFHPFLFILKKWIHTSLEEVVGLLVHLFVGHLFEPGLSHVSFAGGLLVAESVIFGLLDHQSVPKVAQVLVVLVVLTVLVVRGLVVKLVNKRVVVPVSLASILHIHLVDDFLILLGAIVRLVVLLSVEFVVGSLLSVPLLLLVDERLVQLQVRVRGVSSFLSLCSAQVNVVVELVLLTFTLLLQTHKIFFISLQGGQGCLISYSHLLLVVGVAIAERVVVVREGSV